MTHTIELWRWTITDPVTGRRRETRHLMIERDALMEDPTAERLDGTLEVRELPDDLLQMNTSAWQGKLPDVR